MTLQLVAHMEARTESPEQSQWNLHSRLTAFNACRLKPGYAGSNWRAELGEEYQSRVEEAVFVEGECSAVQTALRDLPEDEHGFMRWFEALRERGPGQGDPLFRWLAERASRAQMRWFLLQEVAGEAGFDDLVALTQVRFPIRAKLEMARNYWDEMGRGHERGMHGPMLDRTAQELNVSPTPRATVWESLALANLMAALAANRRYAYQSVGALGVIEMTAPGRVAKVSDGLQRLGISQSGRQYFQLHAGLDVRHSAAWNAEVIAPLVASEPRCARPIAEGALLRLVAGSRCYARYRREFGLH